jgi:hypothetical protein
MRQSTEPAHREAAGCRAGSVGRALRLSVELADVLPMLEQTALIEIAAPPSAVFAAAGSLDWFGPDIAIIRLSGSEGLGGTYELRTHALGSDLAFVFMVDVADEPRRVGFSSVGARECSFEGEYLIEPDAAGTAVQLHVRVVPHGRFRFFKPLLPPLMQHAMADTLARLKDHVEQRLAAAA